MQVLLSENGMSAVADTTSPTSDVLPKAPIYESSTQFLHWRFSPEQLSRMRITLNTTAVAAIRKTLEVEKVRCLVSF